MEEAHPSREFIVVHHDGRDSQYFPGDQLRPGAVGGGKVWLGLQRNGKQSNGPQAGPQHFEDPILTPVAPDDLARKMIQLQEFANLIGIPPSQKNLVALLLEFFDNRHEEGNVGRIIQIDPDLLLNERSL
jgi:hypothetical protein